MPLILASPILTISAFLSSMLIVRITRRMNEDSAAARSFTFFLLVHLGRVWEWVSEFVMSATFARLNDVFRISLTSRSDKNTLYT